MANPDPHPTPIDDPARLQSLAETGLLDAPARSVLQRHAQVAARAIDAPVALVSLVDVDRQFFAAAHGLQAPWAERRQTPLSHSFCQHVVRDGRSLVVSDARGDPRVCDNLAIPELAVVAYAGVPLCDPEGRVLGSLCVIDDQPRAWTDREISLLELLAETVSADIELSRRTKAAEHAEADLAQINQEIAAAHEQYAEDSAAVMHDLRTPLQVLSMALATASDHPSVHQSPALQESLEMMKRNLRQVLKLVKTSRGQPTEGERFRRIDAGELVARVCGDLAAASPVTVDCVVAPSPVIAEPMMVRRAIQNLVTNAQRFARHRLSVRVETQRDMVSIVVEDDGDGLPREEDYERVWDVGRRFHGARSNTGLGLAVTRQLIQALGGRVRARPSELGGARFELWLALAEEADRD